MTPGVQLIVIKDEKGGLWRIEKPESVMIALQITKDVARQLKAEEGKYGSTMMIGTGDGQTLLNSIDAMCNYARVFGLPEIAIFGAYTHSIVPRGRQL